MLLLTILRIPSCVRILILNIRMGLMTIYVVRISSILTCQVVIFHHLNICRLRGIKDRRRWIISEMQNFLLNCWWLVLTRTDSLRWTLMVSMTVRLIISAHYHLSKVVNILNILDNAVPFHIFHEALLLGLLVSLAYWWSAGRLSDCSIFNLKASWRDACICIEHLYTNKPAKFFLSKLSRSSCSCTRTVLVYHPFNEISSKLGLILDTSWDHLSICRIKVLLRNLNLVLLLHLNLNVSDSRWHLTIDHEIRRRGRALSDFVLTNDLNASCICLVICWCAKGSH